MERVLHTTHFIFDVFNFPSFFTVYLLCEIYSVWIDFFALYCYIIVHFFFLFVFPFITSYSFYQSCDKTLNFVPWIWNGCFIPPILSLTFSISQVSLRFTFCVKSILLGSNFLPLIVTLSSIPSNLIFLSTFGV